MVRKLAESFHHERSGKKFCKGDRVYVRCDCETETTGYDFCLKPGVVLCTHPGAMCVKFDGRIGTGSGCGRTWLVDNHDCIYDVDLIRRAVFNPLLSQLTEWSNA